MSLFQLEGSSTKNQVRQWLTVVILLMLAAMMFMSPATAFAAGATISVSDAGEVKPGQEFSVSVNIEDNPGFAAAALEFIYDSEVLEFVGFGSDGLIGGVIIPNVDEATFAYFSGADLRSNGVLFTAHFKVKDNAASGNYTIQIGLRNGTAANLVNAQAETVTATYTAGTVTVGDGLSTNNNSNNNNNNNQPSEPTKVTATAADGSSVDILLRNGVAGMEYSLDDGLTWQAVPADGLIHTLDGQGISIYGKEGSDYVVDELPPALTDGGDTQAGGVPWQVIVGIAVILVAIVVAFIIVRRRQASKQFHFQRRHSDS
jgi:hypothetical protein